MLIIFRHRVRGLIMMMVMRQNMILPRLKSQASKMTPRHLCAKSNDGAAAIGLVGLGLARSCSCPRSFSATPGMHSIR